MLVYSEEKWLEIARKLADEIDRETLFPDKPTYVYVLRCETTDHFYVGQTTKLEQRFNAHIMSAKGNPEDYLMHASTWFIATHGIDTVVMTLLMPSVAGAKELEVKLARHIVEQGAVANCGVHLFFDDSGWPQVMNLATQEVLTGQARKDWLLRMRIVDRKHEELEHA